jgi:tetratricopeptide (TPR) repeat protein
MLIPIISSGMLFPDSDCRLERGGFMILPGIALVILTTWDVPMIGRLLAVLVVVGAYVLNLRNMGHCPPELRLRRKGLDLLLAGKPDKAEKYYRQSLAMLAPSDQVRPLVCLADALMDQGRYQESQEYLERALKLGDSTGSGQNSMADLLLKMGTDPEKALDMAEQAVELSTGRSRRDIYFGGGVYNDLKCAKYWARRSQALVQLNRQSEARQAIDRAVRLVENAHTEARQTRPRNSFLVMLVIGSRRLSNHRDLAIATAHWQIGLAFLAIGDSSKAVEHFRITRDTDRRGKYRRLAQQQLTRLESRL